MRNPPGNANTEPEIDRKRGLQACREKPTFLYGAGLEFKVSLQHLKLTLLRNPDSNNCDRSQIAKKRDQIRRWPKRTIKSADAGGPVSVHTLARNVLQTKRTDSNRLNASNDRSRSGTSIAAIDIRLGTPNRIGVQQHDFKVDWLRSLLDCPESPLQQSLV